MTAFLSGYVIASLPHSFAQRRHPRQSSSFTAGFPLACCFIFPARLPHPIPMFLIAPPNPVASCPLKWLKLMKISASMIACPIRAVSQYSPLTTGTSTSSVPRKPSPMMIWHPVEIGLKPFRFAQSRCSSAFFLLPGYKVLQSVRNGSPPCSLQRSATAFA